MKKKIISYLLIFLIIPLIISLSLSCTNYAKKDPISKNGYNGLDVPKYNTDTTNYKIKSSSPYAYITVFCSISLFGCVYLYIKKKKGW